MDLLKITGLFVLTALAEIVGCYLPWLVLKQGHSYWLLLPATLSLGLFAWLLTLHPGPSGRIYAAYGGVYVAMSLIWLWTVDGVRPSLSDGLGSSLVLLGMAVIALQARN
jgi:small multidrug resistance family-3 protein